MLLRIKVRHNLHRLDRMGLSKNPAQDFRSTIRAIDKGLTAIHSTWLAAVTGKVVLPGCRRINNRTYGDSLGIKAGAAFGGSAMLIRGAVIAHWEYARDIERGYPAFDLKPALLASPKARKSKRGGRYVIIPFRWATPKTSTNSGGFAARMDEGLYSKAVKLKQSGPNNWSSHLKHRDLAETDAHHGTSHAATMASWTGYRHHGPKALTMHKLGAPGHRYYMTFRTVSEHSDPSSWWHPGQKPNPIRDATADMMFPLITPMVHAAFERDVRRLMNIRD